MNVILRDPPCVAVNTVVVEGMLRGYDAPHVFLMGSELPMDSEAYPPLFPVRECSVEGDHYTCTSLGYRYTEWQTVVVVQGKRSEGKSAALEVSDCNAVAAHLDFERATLDAGIEQPR